jgi:hypothetical protein
MNKELDEVHAIIVCEGGDADKDTNVEAMKAAHNQFTFENKVFLQLKQYVKMLKR